MDLSLQQRDEMKLYYFKNKTKKKVLSSVEIIKLIMNNNKIDAR